MSVANALPTLLLVKTVRARRLDIIIGGGRILSCWPISPGFSLHVTGSILIISKRKLIIYRYIIIICIFLFNIKIYNDQVTQKEIIRTALINFKRYKQSQKQKTFTHNHPYPSFVKINGDSLRHGICEVILEIRTVK